VNAPTLNGRACRCRLIISRGKGFDAAILFSDILTVPHALWQRVTFGEGEGPLLDALKDLSGKRCSAIADCAAARPSSESTMSPAQVAFTVTRPHIHIHLSSGRSYAFMEVPQSIAAKRACSLSVTIPTKFPS
jgi:hypothetical protein